MLNFMVLRDYNGKPIRNASVVMHPVQKNGKQSKGGLQIKTDAEGKASFDGAPSGSCGCRCWRQGFQTFGADYDVDKPTLEITVKMKRPGGSIPSTKTIRARRRMRSREPDSKEKPQ